MVVSEKTNLTVILILQFDLRKNPSRRETYQLARPTTAKARRRQRNIQKNPPAQGKEEEEPPTGKKVDHPKGNEKLREGGQAKREKESGQAIPNGSQ